MVYVIGRWMLVLGMMAFLVQPLFADSVPRVTEFSTENDFASFPGVSGKGTKMEPYLISGLTFDAQEQTYALRLVRVRVYAVFKKCKFTGASRAGVLLQDVSHVWFVECEFSGNKSAIELYGVCEDVVFTLCSFKDNDMLVSGIGRGVSWDDGNVGNWWDNYRGTDANSDGLGDTLHVIAPGHVDYHPLISPFDSLTERDKGYLLQVKMNVGESYEFEIKGDVKITMYIGIPIGMTVTFKQRVLEQVIGDRGGMVYTLKQAIVEDTGSVTVFGVEQPYESAEGDVLFTTAHRFGIYGMGGEGQTAIPAPPVSFPVRWVKEGDTWTFDFAADAEDLGLSSGFGFYTGSVTLQGIETRVVDKERKECAVLNIDLNLSGEGIERNPLLGELTGLVQGNVSATRWVDLETGREVESRGKFLVQTKLYLDGEFVGKAVMEGTFHVILIREEKCSARPYRGAAGSRGAW